MLGRFSLVLHWAITLLSFGAITTVDAAQEVWSSVLAPLHAKYDKQKQNLLAVTDGVYTCNTTTGPDVNWYPWAQPMKLAEHYCELHERFVGEIALLNTTRTSCGVLFFGDSLVSSLRWPWLINMGSDEVFLNYTKQYNAMAFGISMDTTSSLMWRMLSGAAPINMNVKLAVLHIGINDLWAALQTLTDGQEDPDHVLQQTRAAAVNEVTIAQYLIEQDPQLQVLLIGPLPPNRKPGFPSTDEDKYQHPNWLTEPVARSGHYLAAAVKKVNQHEQGTARIHYTSCWKVWTPEGATTINPEWTQDGSHPTAAGWQVLFEHCIAPAIQRILGY